MDRSRSGRTESGQASRSKASLTQPSSRDPGAVPLRNSQKAKTSDEFSPRLAHVYHSNNHNDTELNRRMANRLYNKYSASQDYYYSSRVNNILSEAQTPGAIAYFDVLTFLDEDEYLKRFYEFFE